VSLDLSRIAEPATPAASTPAATGAAPDRTARERQREQLTRIAQEFESMLLVQVLRDMRRAGSWDGGEDEPKGFGAQIMGDTIDVELAGHLSRNKGLGLASQLLESMGRMDGLIPPAGGPAAGGGINGTVRAAQSAIDALRNAQPAALRDGQPDTLGSARSDALSSAHLDVLRNAPLEALRHARLEAVGNVVQPEAAIVEPQGERHAGPGPRLTSAFGWRTDPFTGREKFHKGIDLAAVYGQDVQAARAGRVAVSGAQGGYGTTIVIEHPDGTRSRYAHLSATLVEPGTMVEAGQLVGRAGNSGRATGTHLHFEVTGADGQPLSPSLWSNGRIG